MTRWWHRPLAASGAVASMVGCSQPAPTAQRSRAPETAPSAPSADDAATTTTEAPTTTLRVTTTSTVVLVPAVVLTVPLPEDEGEDLSDEEWWESQPGFVAGACGGSLPPCWVMQRESGGNPTIYNRQGSGASGKWQFMPGTWAGYGGYANAADAPERVQDEKARQVWAGGRGCSHWDAC